MVQKGKFSTGTAHLVYNTITIRTFIWVYGTEGEVFSRCGTLGQHIEEGGFPET